MAVKKVLFVCVHNTGRSQMAEAFLNSMSGGEFIAESAGLEPSAMNPLVIETMNEEEGIDLSAKSSDSVFEFFKSGKLYNYVVTVCDDDSAERCPIFPGVTYRIHWNYPDPTKFEEDNEDNRARVRHIKDGVKKEVEKFIELVKEKRLEDNVPFGWKVSPKWMEE